MYNELESNTHKEHAMTVQELIERMISACDQAGVDPNTTIAHVAVIDGTQLVPVLNVSCIEPGGKNSSVIELTIDRDDLAEDMEDDDDA